MSAISLTYCCDSLFIQIGHFVTIATEDVEVTDHRVACTTFCTNNVRAVIHFCVWKT